MAFIWIWKSMLLISNYHTLLSCRLVLPWNILEACTWAPNDLSKLSDQCQLLFGTYDKMSFFPFLCCKMQNHSFSNNLTGQPKGSHFQAWLKHTITLRWRKTILLYPKTMYLNLKASRQLPSALTSRPQNNLFLSFTAMQTPHPQPVPLQRRGWIFYYQSNCTFQPDKSSLNLNYTHVVFYKHLHLGLSAL